jgi:F-type H+-transporting ATPase subunit delta
VLGTDPIVSASVNPDLIAGFVIRVGDRVYDGSVRTRLEAMRKGMVARATEAIQTAPQRFFSSEAQAG